MRQILFFLFIIGPYVSTLHGSDWIELTSFAAKAERESLLSGNLYEAISREDELEVKALLKAGANPNMSLIGGLSSLLFLAIESGNEKIVSLLIKHKCDVNQTIKLINTDNNLGTDFMAWWNGTKVNEYLEYSPLAVALIYGDSAVSQISSILVNSGAQFATGDPEYLKEILRQSNDR